MSVRVVHVSASFPRAVDDATAPFLLDLLTAQRAAGWDASVVAAHDAGLPRRQELAGVPIRRVRYGPDDWEVLAYRGGGHGRLRSPLHAALLPGLVAGLALATVAEIRRTKARGTVVHGHWLFPGGVVAALVKPTNGRAVVTLHGPDVELAAGRLRPVARLVARRADAVLAVSEPLARRAEDVLGLPVGSVHVARLPLPLGLEPTALPPLTDGPRLLAAGRASREKGFDVLVEALTRPGAARWRATLVTDGPERPALERQARAAGLGDRVAFVAPQPRAALFELVRAHHAVGVPSRVEGLGMVALEALALGRPVVASAVGGLVEVVADGSDGILVPPDDAGAFAAALARLELAHPTGSAAARHQPDAVLAAHAEAYGVPARAPVAV